MVAHPIVSVLLPVFNCERYLKEAVRSICQQTLTDIELIIVNDGSTDSSLEILKRLAIEDSRIVLIDKPNAGIASALNAGLLNCKGKYIARMDGDDLALPNRFGDQVDFLEANPDVGAVGSWVTVIDENDRETGVLKFPTVHREIDQALATAEYAMLHPTVTIRADTMRRVGGYNPEFRYAEDLDLLLRLGEVTHLSNIPRLLLKYRRRAGSQSTASGVTIAKWDYRALIAARARGRRIHSKVMARAADRISWTSLKEGKRLVAVGYALRSLLASPLSAIGIRSLGRICWP